MDGRADGFSGDNVGSVFGYTYEVHPGEPYPHLTSMEHKFCRARDLQDILSIRRMIPP